MVCRLHEEDLARIDRFSKRLEHETGTKVPRAATLRALLRRALVLAEAQPSAAVDLPAALVKRGRRARGP
jgi:hypothetical protein